MRALAFVLLLLALGVAAFRTGHRYQQAFPGHHRQRSATAAQRFGDAPTRPAVAVAAAAVPASGYASFAAATASGSGATAIAEAGTAVYAKRRPGRHVCTREQAVPERMQTIETYSKPSYITYLKACHDRPGMCNAVRTVYHEGYRTVTKTHFKKQTSYTCCPGWVQTHKHHHGCRKAICSRPCINGGSCSMPDMCACLPGFTGQHCEMDVNECAEKPCDHTCINTDGSFQCECHDGFELQDDGRTCRSQGNITATETKDLLDFELISERLLKLEEQMHKKKQPSTELSIKDLNQKIETLKQQISQLKEQLETVERSQSSTFQYLEELKSYKPQIERINPLCKQVSNIEQQVVSCPCRNELRYRFKPHILS